MVKSLPKNNGSPLDSVFHALADPTRRSILSSVALGEKTVSQVAHPFQISLAAVSKHLNVLEAASLIIRQRKGNYQIVRLNPGPMKEAGEWLAYYERFWDERLDALENLLAEQRETDQTTPQS